MPRQRAWNDPNPQPKPEKLLTPGVVFRPRSAQGLQRGINLLANVIRPTLGPVPRLVAIEPVGPGDKRPELLDNGGLAARRFLALPNRNDDMGAMFLRHVLWRQHERVGDGTATTAVLFQSIYNQGIAYIAAGGSSMLLRRHLEAGLRVILDELTSQAIPLEGRAQTEQIAEAICHEPDLAAMLGEIFDIVSELGQIEIRSGRGVGLERTYVTGSYYRGKLLSQWMVTDQILRRAQLEDVAVLVSDLSIEEPSELIPLLDRLAEAEIGTLMLLVKEISDRAISLLLAAGNAADRPCQVIAVKAPDAVSGQAAM